MAMAKSNRRKLTKILQDRAKILSNSDFISNGTKREAGMILESQWQKLNSYYMKEGGKNGNKNQRRRM